MDQIWHITSLNTWKTPTLGTKLSQSEGNPFFDMCLFSAYSTIAHLLQGNMLGTTPGLAQISPHDLTPQVWDFIFLNGPFPQNSKIPSSVLMTLKKEFEYWYPADYVTADSFSFTIALFFLHHEKFWPHKPLPKILTYQEFWINGNRRNAQHPSCNELIEKYGSDSVRVTFANCGKKGFWCYNFLYKQPLRFWNDLHWIQVSICNYFKATTQNFINYFQIGCSRL